MTDTKTLFEKFGTPIALLVGLLVIAGAIYFGHSVQPAPAAGGNGQPPAVSVNIKNVKTQGEPFVGNANAPVTMALFFDYQCPFCKQFDQTVVSQLYSSYVQQGKLKIVFKDFDFLGPNSIMASEFGRAVWELYPDKFYAWYQAIFSAQVAENRGADSTYLPHLEQLTGTVPGIDVKKVEALMNQKKAAYDATIQNDFTEGQGYGIQGTPSVIVGTTLLQGAQTAATITALIDAQLKK